MLPANSCEAPSVDIPPTRHPFALECAFCFFAKYSRITRSLIYVIPARAPRTPAFPGGNGNYVELRDRPKRDFLGVTETHACGADRERCEH